MTRTVVRPRRCCHEALGDACLGVGVDRARGLDEHEHLGVAHERAGEGHPLALAAGQGAAALLEHAVQAVLDRLEDVEGARDVDPREALLVARPAEGLAQGPAEQVRLGLGHDDAGAHGGDGQVVEGRSPQRTPCRPGRGAAQAVRDDRGLLRRARSRGP